MLSWSDSGGPVRRSIKVSLWRDNGPTREFKSTVPRKPREDKQSINRAIAAIKRARTEVLECGASGRRSIGIAASENMYDRFNPGWVRKYFAEDDLLPHAIVGRRTRERRSRFRAPLLMEFPDHVRRQRHRICDARLYALQSQCSYRAGIVGHPHRPSAGVGEPRFERKSGQASPRFPGSIPESAGRILVKYRLAFSPRSKGSKATKTSGATSDFSTSHHLFEEMGWSTSGLEDALKDAKAYARRCLRANKGWGLIEERFTHAPQSISLALPLIDTQRCEVLMETIKNEAATLERLLRRTEAAQYITDKFGIPCSPKTLAKLACVTSDGPPFRMAWRFPFVSNSTASMTG